MSEFKPNFTQIPNILLDDLMHDLTGGELRCLLYICRRTYGFHRDSDSISYSQFEKGIVNKDGKKVDNGCGISHETISVSLTGLVDRGLIIKKRNGHTFKYSINLESGNPNVKPQEIEVETLRKPDIQKKEKEREIKYSTSIEFLVNLPVETLDTFVEKYNVDKNSVILEGEKAYNWIKSKGKTYKNYEAMLRNWVLGTYGLRINKKDNPAKL